MLETDPEYFIQEVVLSPTAGQSARKLACELLITELLCPYRKEEKKLRCYSDTPQAWTRLLTTSRSKIVKHL